MAFIRPPSTDAELLERLISDLQDTSLKRGHTEVKTIAVGGVDLAVGLAIPRCYVVLDVDDDTPEEKWLIGFMGEVMVGECTVQWNVNGVDVPLLHTLTDPSIAEVPYMLDEPMLLEEVNRVRVSIDSTTGLTQGLSAVLLIVAVPV